MDFDQYMMAVVQVTPSDLSPLRSKLRQPLLPAERKLHLADQISSSAVTSTIYTCECGRFGEPPGKHA